jgi:hypothetical protein
MPRDPPSSIYGEVPAAAGPPQPRPAHRARPQARGRLRRGDEGVLGDEVGLALDCGPGWTVPTRSAGEGGRAAQPDVAGGHADHGDYTPYVLADVYREVTMSTSTPIHTGEQIYLRQNFRELIEKQAVNIVGPDPATWAASPS